MKRISALYKIIGLLTALLLTASIALGAAASVSADETAPATGDVHTESASTEDSLPSVTCSDCGETESDPGESETEELLGGLSTGFTVTIIAVGATLVICGGFSIFWFVIEKKTWGELFRGIRK